MILCIDSSELFFNNIETDKKKMENTIVYRWNSLYVPHVDGYAIKDSFHMINTLATVKKTMMNDDNSPSDILNIVFQYSKAYEYMANMAFEAYLGFDIVILYYRPDKYVKELLEDYNTIFHYRYGLKPRMIYDEEDIPEFPKDCDNISQSGLFYIQEDRPYIMKMYEEESVNSPMFRKFIKDRLDSMAVVL